ncbi:unnamed protein product, partial [Rotaria sp. Silwood2]
EHVTTAQRQSTGAVEQCRTGAAKEKAAGDGDGAYGDVAKGFGIIGAVVGINGEGVGEDVRDGGEGEVGEVGEVADGVQGAAGAEVDGVGEAEGGKVGAGEQSMGEEDYVEGCAG